MGVVLGLDCSGETYSVGLWTADGLALERSGYQPRTALRELPEALGQLLAAAGTAATKVAAVGVTVGPGSFTGVRLGVTVAKTAALVAECPVWGWDTLQVLAHQALPEGSLGIVAVALDARRGELYCALYQRREEGLSVLWPTAVRSPEEFAGALSGLSPAAWVGSGFAAYPWLIPSASAGPRWLGRVESSPSGLLVARLTGQSSDAGGSLFDLEPIYHRRADIQVSAPPVS